jgi:UPF0716 protein FxsA
MARAITLTIVGLFIVDSLLLVGAGWEYGWRAPVYFAIGSVLLGLPVIALALWQFGARISTRLNNDECLTDNTLAGVFLLLAGFLLLLPGLITDAVGLALLFPSVRSYAVKEIRHLFKNNHTHRYA